jgi:hypothetical protein
MSNDTNSTLVDNINLNSKVNVNTLAYILGLSRGALYNDAKSGKFGGKTLSDQTYMEAIQNYRNYFTSGGRAHYANAAANAEGATLVERQLTQKLRADKAAEVKTWLTIAEKRKKLLYEPELRRFYEPFIHIIKNGIVSISLDFPETRTKVDNVLNSLAEFGSVIITQAEEDSDKFLTEMLELDLDSDIAKLSFIAEEVETL